MKAIIFRRGGGAEVRDIGPLSETGEVRIQMMENGICGTDREIVAGKLATVAFGEGRDWMVLGHEAIGRVISNSSEEAEIPAGTIVMPINRRPCGRCANCLRGRADHCETGSAPEAGIRYMDGFMREYIADEEKYLIPIPPSIRQYAILTQPLSDLEKAFQEILYVQGRAEWLCGDATLSCRKALVTGTGPLSMLAALLLRSEGMRVVMSNVRNPYSHEGDIMKAAGVSFYNAAGGYAELAEELEGFDFVFDFTGKPGVLKSYLRYVRRNGAVALFGFSAGEGAWMDSSDMEHITTHSIALLGLVNGQKPHFLKAVSHISEWKETFPSVLDRMITGSVNAEDEKMVLRALERKEAGEVKTKIVWES